MNPFIVLLALVALTLLSWGLSYAPLGQAATVVALTIAVVKAGMVVNYFMELHRTGIAIRVAVVVTLAGILLLCAGLVADVQLR